MLLIFGLPPKFPEAFAVAQARTIVRRPPIEGLPYVLEEFIGVGFLLR
jgi:hypothetical protein